MALHKPHGGFESNPRTRSGNVKRATSLHRSGSIPV